MFKFLVQLVLCGVAVMLAAHFAPGVEVNSLWTAISVAIVFGLTNAVIGTVLRAFTLPFNFLTLGLVSFFITIMMVFLTDHWVDGFSVARWYHAGIFAILLGLINGLLGTDHTKK